MNIDDIIENARLKGRVIALEAEVQTLTAEVRCLEAVIRSHERVDSLIVANLKAENARLRASSFVTAVPSEEYEKLKAEVERLKAEPERLAFLLNNAYLDKERLRKIGTEMGKHLLDTDEANAAYRAFEYAAKEGKPSV